MPKKLAALKYLIVEGSRTYPKVLMGMLAKLGVKSISCVESVDEAIRSLKVEQHDVVLSDMALAEFFSGQRILNFARHKLPVLRQPLFLMLATDRCVDLSLYSDDPSPDGYLMTPISIGVLEKTLTKTIAERQRFLPVYVALEREDLSAAHRICNDIIKERSEYVLQAIRTKADIYLQQEKYEKALELYDSILQKHYLIWAKLGQAKCQYYLHQYQQAEDALQCVISVNNNVVAAHDWLAKVSLEFDDHATALSSLQTAIGIEADNPDRQYALAKTAYTCNDQDLCLRALKRANHLYDKAQSHSSEFMMWYLNTIVAYLPTMKRADKQITFNEGERLIDKIRYTFKREKSILLEVLVLEYRMHMAAGHWHGSGNRLRDLMITYKKDEKFSTVSIKQQLARLFISENDKENAAEIIEELVALGDNSAHYLDKDFTKFVSHAAENSKAIELYKSGDHQTAMSMLSALLDEYPLSLTFNLNYAQIAINYLQKKDHDNEQVYQKIEDSLSRIHYGSLNRKQVKRYVELEKQYKQLDF